MTLHRLPFPGHLNNDVSEYFLQAGGIKLINGVVEARHDMMAVNTRPGTVEHQQVHPTAGVDGVYYWDAKGVIVAVANGRLYAANSFDSSFEIKSDHENRIPRGPVQFAATNNFLYISSKSGHILQWDGVGQATHVTDEVAPTDVSSIVFINGRVLASENGTRRIWYTKPVQVDAQVDPLEWEGYFDVVRTDDRVLGMSVLGSDLVIFLRKSTELWYNDGVTPFRPIPGGAFDIGLGSVSGFTQMNDALYWITDDRKIVRMLGRTPSNISDGHIDAALQNVNVVSNTLTCAARRYIMFSFPEAKLTYVFDTKFHVWYQWSTLQSGLHLTFNARTASNLPDGRTLLGGKDGRTYFFTDQEFRDAGAPIQFKFRTPHYDLGTLDKKLSSRTLIKVSKPPVKDPEPGWFASGDRCVEFSFTFPEGSQYAIPTVPEGFSYDSASRTLSAPAEDRPVGSREVSVKETKPNGETVTKVLTLVVNDFVPMIWIGD